MQLVVILFAFKERLMERGKNVHGLALLHTAGRQATATGSTLNRLVCSQMSAGNPE